MLLAHRPFIDALTLHSVWFTMLIPLAFFISITWKAVRLPDVAGAGNHPRFPWKGFAFGVVSMTVQIVVSMIALGAVSYLMVQYAAPALVPK